MAKFDIVMPKMGESVQEATITKWFVKAGDVIEEDDVLFEISTDKVDSEIPSPVAGKVSKVNFEEGALVPVGDVVAVIAMDGEEEQEDSNNDRDNEDSTARQQPDTQQTEPKGVSDDFNTQSDHFYSPLVRNIAKQENVSLEELESIEGSGQGGRVNKHDILAYIEDRKAGKTKAPQQTTPSEQSKQPANTGFQIPQAPPVTIGEGDEVKEMDRVRRLIADHMVMSAHVSPHVTSMVEADVSNIVQWREKVKNDFLAREKEKITYMPIFVEAIVKALKDFPGVNVSVDGNKIIYRKAINIGMAVAQPNGNLIVPVIKQTDHLNMLGLSKEINRLAQAARNNKLQPDDIQGGTFTVTNFGSFGNIMGTPIINQPQVAILATGAIQKKPAVIETPTGDMIGIRHKMYLSLSYDHRVVDGALGGAFLKRIADYLEDFDVNRTV